MSCGGRLSVDMMMMMILSYHLLRRCNNHLTNEGIETCGLFTPCRCRTKALDIHNAMIRCVLILLMKSAQHKGLTSQLAQLWACQQWPIATADWIKKIAMKTVFVFVTSTALGYGKLLNVNLLSKCRSITSDCLIGFYIVTICIQRTL